MVSWKGPLSSWCPFVLTATYFPGNHERKTRYSSSLCRRFCLTSFDRRSERVLLRNPLIDSPSASISVQHRTEWPEYYAQNIWPKPDEKGVEGFEEAFKDLGGKWGCGLLLYFVRSTFLFKIRLRRWLRTSSSMQPFGTSIFWYDFTITYLTRWLPALSRFSDTSLSLPKLISTSQTTKARYCIIFRPLQTILCRRKTSLWTVGAVSILIIPF